MAAEIDRLVVRLEGDLTQLRSALAAGVQTSRSASQAMTSSFSSVTGVLEHVTGASNLMRSAVSALTVGTLVQAARSNLAYASSVGDIARQLNFSTDALQRNRYAASQLGLSNDQLEGGIGRLNLKLGEASNEGGEALRRFERLGITLKEIRESTPEEMLYRVVDALSAVQDSNERTALTAELLGKEMGPKFAKVIDAGSAGLRSLGDEAERVGAVLDQSLIEKADETEDKLEAFAQIARTQVASAMVETATAVQAAAEWVAELVLRMQGIRPNADGLNSLRDRIAALDAQIEDLGAHSLTNLFSQRGAFSAPLLEAKAAALREERSALQAELNRLLNPPKAALKQGPAEDPNRLTLDQVKKAKEWEQFRQKLREEGLQMFRDALVAEEREMRESGERQLEQAKRINEGMRASLGFRAQLAGGVVQNYTGGKEGVTAATARQAQEAQEAQMLAAEDLRYEAQRMELEGNLASNYELQSAQSEHEATMTAIKQAGADARKAIDDTERGNVLEGTKSFLNNLSALTSSHSRKAFELGKAAAIAGAAVAAVESGIDAYKFGNKIGGPVVGAAFAAAAVAAQYAKIQQLKGLQFGGGGGAAAGTTGAGGAPVTNASGGVGLQQGPATFITLNGQGGLYSEDSVRDLIKRISEAQGDGSRIQVLS